MVAGTAAFVQFPHPGGEHVPPSDDMPWNVDAHRRKYLRARGRYVDADDHLATSEVVFWGEWEAPSHVDQRWPPATNLPRAVHRPYWTRPNSGGFRQNTDPWVYGQHMLYSNCKQITGPQRRPTSMQRIRQGSVICFGSTIDHEFCVDTVFVVASAEPWTPAHVADLDVDDAFPVCTAESITAGGTNAHAELTLYRGATFDNPVDGMYSFVPALPDTDDEAPRFARPPLRLPGLINPANTQSTWGSKRPLPISAVRDAWEAVRHQVLTAGLVLAVHLDTPAQAGAHDSVPPSTNAKC